MSDRDREEFLRRLASGELSPEEKSEALYQDEAAELNYLLERLGELGHDERACLEEAAELESAPGEDRVASTVYELAGVPSDRRGRRWMVPVAIAAGLLTLLSYMLFFQDSGRDELKTEGVTLGDSIEIISPRDKVSDYGTFEWKGRLEDGATFELRIWDADERDAAPLRVVRDLTSHQWSSAGEVGDKALPESIVWQVIQRRGRDVLEESALQSASLSP